LPAWTLGGTNDDLTGIFFQYAVVKLNSSKTSVLLPDSKTSPPSFRNRFLDESYAAIGLVTLLEGLPFTGSFSIDNPKADQIKKINIINFIISNILI
jgi:hypothetical protein